jgi:hypothetical protein
MRRSNAMRCHTSRRTVTAFASLGGVVLISLAAYAATPAVELFGGDPLDVNEVGTDVAAFGGYLAASSPFENAGQIEAGPPSFTSRVRLFNQGNFVRDYFIPELCPFSIGGHKNSLSIGARGLVVGLQSYSCGGTNQAGAVLLYPRQGSDYSTSHTLLAPPAGVPANTRYGAATATHGDWIAIGAPASFAGQQGRVDTWRWNGTAWVRHGWLPSPAGLADNSGFGAAVAVHEDLMIVGAPNAHMFYVYHREQGNWVLRAQYQGGGPTGSNVDITNSYLVSSKDHLVTIYRRVWNGWVPHQTITHPQFPGATWGTDVAIDQHRLIIGTGVFQTVAIYGLQGNYVHLGNMQFNLAGGSGELNALPRIGFSVAIDNDDIIAGDPNADYADPTRPSSTGAIFFQKYYWVY